MRWRWPAALVNLLIKLRTADPLANVISAMFGLHRMKNGRCEFGIAGSICFGKFLSPSPFMPFPQTFQKRLTTVSMELKSAYNNLQVSNTFSSKLVKDLWSGQSGVQQTYRCRAGQLTNHTDTARVASNLPQDRSAPVKNGLSLADSFISFIRALGATSSRLDQPR
jgi:hypothetical protein